MKFVSNNCCLSLNEGAFTDLLLKVGGCEMEAVEGDKVALQQPYKEHEVDAVVELRLKLRHLQVHLVQVSVHEVDERLQQTHTFHLDQHTSDIWYKISAHIRL